MSEQCIDPHHGEEIALTGESLTIADVVAVARGRAQVAPLAASSRMIESRAWVEKVVSRDIVDDQGKPLAVYGVNTPYGSLAFRNVFETPEQARRLSRNLIVSHAAGVGRCFAEDVVRAAMLIRANTLAKGFSGIRPQVVNSLVQALNADIYPAVPEKGSVGASGDLAPLAHLALLISKPPAGLDVEEESGEVLVPFDPQLQQPDDGLVTGAVGEEAPKARVFAKSVLEAAGVARWVLEAKEGVALINGATFSAAMATLAVHDAELLVHNAETALAMTVEAAKGYRDAFLPQVHMARGQRGQMESAAQVLRLLAGSELLDGDEATNPRRSPPQDAYSIRCGPQVIGAVREVLSWVRQIVEKEINAATDNPLIFASGEDDAYFLPRQCKAVSGGNFHGELLAMAMDFLGIAVAELGNIAERRVFRLLSEQSSRGLDSMLVHAAEGEAGLQNGFMIAQVTAAALASENKVLAHPDSVDSIPTSENQEDHVSMAPNAARHAREIIWNVQQIVGIEMLCAAQALDFRLAGTEYVERPHPTDRAYRRREWQRAGTVRLGVGTRAAYDCLRASVGFWDQDRVMYPDLAKAAALVASGEVVRAVQKALE